MWMNSIGLGARTAVAAEAMGIADGARTNCPEEATNAAAGAAGALGEKKPHNAQ